MWSATVLTAVAISWILAIVVCVRIGRSVPASAVDVHRSRLLLQAATLNVSARLVVVLAGGAAPILTATLRSGLSWSGLMLGVVIITLPCKACWNYATGATRLAQQFALDECRSASIKGHIARIADRFGIRVPTIMTSPDVELPFVFGRRSSQATLAVPPDFESMDPHDRETTLLHELAHIRNRDVGFLTWARAFFQDLAWLLLVMTVLAFLLLITGQSFGGPHLFPMALYLACLLQLWLLYRIVLRDRERLADRTASLLMDADPTNPIVNHLFATPAIDAVSNHGHRPPWSKRLSQWLADKAMFGRSRRVWNVLWRGMEFIRATHPSIADRSDSRETASLASINRPPILPVLESLWVGLVIGTAGSVVVEGARVYAALFSLTPNDAGVVVGRAFALAGPWVVAAGTILLTLPAWSSQQALRPTVRALSQLAVRTLLVAATSMGTSAILLTGFWFRAETTPWAAAPVAWCGLVCATALAGSVTLIVLWHTFRFLPHRVLTELKTVAVILGVGLLPNVGLAIADLLLTGARPTTITIMGASLLLGLILVSAVLGRTRVSGSDAYLLYDFVGVKRRFEGTTMRRGVCVIVATVALVSAIPVVVCLLLVVGSNAPASNEPSALLTIGILLAMGLVAMIPLSRRRSSDIPARRRRVGALIRALRLLKTRPLASSDRSRGTVELRMGHEFISTAAETVDDFVERWSIASASSPPRHALDRETRWVSACERDGGFGLWPGSTPRLGATCRALTLLKAVGVSPDQPLTRHVEWILARQHPDGPFHGPWSRRPRLEDTYDAVKSLELVGCCLAGESRQRCGAWVRTQVFADMAPNGTPEDVRFAVGILEALGRFEPDVRRRIARWAEDIVWTLALANPVHVAEALEHTLQVLVICSADASLDSQLVTLLDRLRTRLEVTIEAQLR